MPRFKYVCPECGTLYRDWDDLAHEVDCPACNVPADCWWEDATENGG